MTFLATTFITVHVVNLLSICHARTICLELNCHITRMEVIISSTAENASFMTILVLFRIETSHYDYFRFYSFSGKSHARY